MSPSPTPECPTAMRGCLAGDDFDRRDGPILEAASGQPWITSGSACSDCHPVFEVHHGEARIGPGREKKNFIWVATVDTGRADGIVVAADITLSPTPRRANAGLVALFRDRENHLTCKIEVTEGNPDGLIAIGDQLDGVTTSLLADRRNIGLRSGATYHLELSILPSPNDRPPRARCVVSGPDVKKIAVAVRVSQAGSSAYGEGTAQGLRIKIFDDEDDGRTTWDNFWVRVP